MRTRNAALTAWSVCLLSVALSAGAFALGVFTGTNDDAVGLPLAMTASAVVGGLVASRRPENPIGWFFLGSGACFALLAFASRYVAYGLLTTPAALPPGIQVMVWLQSWLWVPGVMLLLSFVPLYFPDGRLVSRRWRWVVGFALLFSVVGASFNALRPGEIQGEGIVNPLGIEALRPALGLLDTSVFALYFTLLFTSAASLVVRFGRSSPRERQQIKWLAFAALAIPIWFLTNAPIEAAAPTIFLVVDSLVFAMIPVAAGIAILRYRLYDIDLIINRTLVYGSLTATLVVVYFGGVVGLQYVLRAVTGQGSTLAVVASTLAIAALFNPLRGGVQRFVDRRFYRRKYDAVKTLEAFSATLRDETDLDALNDELAGVVSETMQPAHVSVWLRPDTAQ